MSRFIYGMVTIALLAIGPAGHAEVFKCTAEDGSLTFQQTPCPEQKVEIVNTKESTGTDLDCRYAARFAENTARHMRAGVRSNEAFDRFGGLDALSRSSIGVINYVYSFRTNDDVSVERIAGLAQARCQAGSFGDASCNALPASFTDGLGGCDGELQDNVTAPEDLVACKKRYRDAIDAIDAEMRRGYSSEQGEVYRQRLRQLTQNLRAC